MRKPDGYLYCRQLQRSMPYYGRLPWYRRFLWKMLGFVWYDKKRFE